MFHLCCSTQNTNSTDVPDIAGKLLNSDSLNLRTIAKGKLTLVNVWGIFCIPCMKELPILHKVYDKYKNRNDFAFITVATDNEKELLRFLDPRDTSDIYRKLFVYSGLDSFYLPTLACLQHGFSKYYSGYTIIQDSTELKRIDRMIKSWEIPTTLIYSPRGKLIFKQIGSFDNDQLLTHKIDSLLAVN